MDGEKKRKTQKNVVTAQLIVCVVTLIAMVAVRYAAPEFYAGAVEEYREMTKKIEQLEFTVRQHFIAPKVGKKASRSDA